MEKNMNDLAVSTQSAMEEIASILARGYLRLIEKRARVTPSNTGEKSSNSRVKGLDVSGNPSPHERDVNDTKNQKRFIHGDLS